MMTNSRAPNMRNSPRLKRASTKSRANRFCGPLSRSGRNFSSPVSMACRILSRCSVTAARSAALEALRAASWALRLGVGAPLPVTALRAAASVACWSTMSCADGASFLRPNTPKEYPADTGPRPSPHGAGPGVMLFVVIQSTGSVLAMTSSTAGNPQTTMDHEGTIDAEALRQAVAESFDETIGQLKDLVAIPGIAWPSFDPAPLNRSADAVASLVRASGFDDVRVLRCDKEDGTPGGPAVVARRPAAEGKPTVLLYAHHDVQPTGDLALWETDPFTAVERDGRLYGRGAADDKAGILAHVAAYSAVSRVLGEELGLGVTFFFEGEEEAGSPTFRAFLETHQELLRSDVIVVADSSNWKVGIPALTTSLRGLVDGTIEVKVLDHAVHSGMFGGPVLDAPTLLARLIATLHDDEGSVAVKGLVSRDDVVVDLTEEEYRADASVLDGVKLAGTGSIASRMWTKPALSIIGFDAPAVDVASNTL